ncbi:hypothetical protein VPH35_110747 [Triticum aestivum]
MWSLEGAKEVLGKFCIIDRLDSHTFECWDTRTFAAWVWVWNLTDIPTRHFLSSFEEGANCAVPPPPEGERSSLLFHIDRVEDWTPREPRSPASYQSGLPSSGSSSND